MLFIEFSCKIEQYILFYSKTSTRLNWLNMVDSKSKNDLSKCLFETSLVIFSTIATNKYNSNFNRPLNYPNKKWHSLIWSYHGAKCALFSYLVVRTVFNPLGSALNPNAWPGYPKNFWVPSSNLLPQTRQVFWQLICVNKRGGTFYYWLFFQPSPIKNSLK